MGEAKRRRLVMGVPVEKFRAPDGYVGFTFDVAGASPVSLCVEADKLVALLDAVQEALAATGRPVLRDDLTWHAKTRGAVTRIFREASMERREGAVHLALWLAFNHPAGGAGVRRIVSEMLRRDGRCHVTTCIDANGVMATAVAPGFADLDELLSHAGGLTEPLVVGFGTKTERRQQ